MINLRSTLAAVLFAVLTAAAAVAQEHPGHAGANVEHGKRAEQSQHDADEKRGSGPSPGVLSLLPPDSVTEHSIATKSGPLAYTATAGTFPLFDQSGAQSASVFYTAYVAKGGDNGGNAAARPVTFVFNGGPGAASAFLNLGLVGPRIAEFGPSGRDGAKTRLVDNPDTWLGFTDLVLIDPIGTGWSRAAKRDDDRGFWSVDGDAQSMAKVIALYVAKNGRAASPKFILGESYGGFRAAKVARVLQDDQGIVVSGILMLSPLLDGNFQFGGDRFALGAALQLPSLAAAELERKGTFSPQALAPAEHFALNDYLTTLAGPPPQGDAAKDFYARVAKITGVSEEAIARSRGFIRDDYVKNLAGDHKIVSHYDATFASDDPYPETPVDRGPDPILDGMIRAYGGAFVGYARDELGFKTEMTYNLLDGAISRQWDWQRDHGQPSVMDDIRDLLALTPSFRLMIAHGYSDMVTPYAVTRYLLQHLPPFSGEARTTLKLYRGGHMFYLDPDSRKAFTADARTMYVQP
ncbi:MAG TPA: carboxypeptidase [Xanthobacteraceae bacterium]|nr:carboxypeptidase [Xanthobacteraceae bacterium]